MSRTRKANLYLLWSAIKEISLDMYSEFKGYAIHVPSVQNKLLNLKVDLERNSKKIHEMFSKDKTGQEEINYYRIVNILEKLIESAHDMDKFSERLGIIEKGLNGEYTMVDEEQFKELIKQTDESNI
jgi:hypothetical protein